MAKMLMQITLIVDSQTFARPSVVRSRLRRQLRPTSVVNDRVWERVRAGGQSEDGWSHFEHDTIKQTVMR